MVKSMKASNWYADPADFKTLVRDAQLQARSEWDQQFAAQMAIAQQQRGLDAPLNLWLISGGLPIGWVKP